MISALFLTVGVHSSTNVKICEQVKIFLNPANTQCSSQEFLMRKRHIFLMRKRHIFLMRKRHTFLMRKRHIFLMRKRHIFLATCSLLILPIIRNQNKSRTILHTVFEIFVNNNYWYKTQNVSWWVL